MTKINKATARKLYNNGNNIIIVPCKMNPSSPWLNSPTSNNNDNTDFDTLCNYITYYQCSSETGQRLAFYTE